MQQKLYVKTTPQNHKQKQPCQQTPCSIKQTYWWDTVLSNEKDGPKMTTAQCNRSRRLSWLQCVRDGQRTKDHENSTRHATNKKKSTTILHAPYAGSDDAWWRRCAAHDDDEGRKAWMKREIQNYKKMIENSLPHNHIHHNNKTQNHKQKQPWQQTPCSIKQTYRRDAVLSNEKDGPKMTTAQCNRRRGWSWLQCVRDGERTKDHENSARHATNK